MMSSQAWMPWTRSGLTATVRALVVMACVAGCESNGGGDPVVTRAAYDSLEAGKASLEAGKIAEARDALEAATTKGGLQPDFYCEGVYLLGRCEALLGNFDKARAAVDILDQGDPDPARVKNLREFIREEAARRPPVPPEKRSHETRSETRAGSAQSAKSRDGLIRGSYAARRLQPVQVTNLRSIAFIAPQ